MSGTHFAASGRNLVCLVYLVYLVHLVEKRTKPDKLGKPPKITGRRPSESFSVHHLTLNIPTPALFSHSDGPGRPEKVECPRFFALIGLWAARQPKPNS